MHNMMTSCCIVLYRFRHCHCHCCPCHPASLLRLLCYVTQLDCPFPTIHYITLHYRSIHSMMEKKDKHTPSAAFVFILQKYLLPKQALNLNYVHMYKCTNGVVLVCPWLAVLWMESLMFMLYCRSICNHRDGIHLSSASLSVSLDKCTHINKVSLIVCIQMLYVDAGERKRKQSRLAHRDPTNRK